MCIQIIADSTCDIDPALIEGMNLKILPLSVTVGERDYLDGETIHLAEIYDFMRRGIIPKTAQISYDRTRSLFQSCFKNGYDIIYISFSSAMSGCFTLARMIAKDLKDEFSSRKIAVLDSKGGSGATGLMVMQALKMVASGCPFETICSEIRFMADHIEHVFSIDRLDWLAKGGRIPKIVGSLGSRLGIHPILEVQKGSIIVKRMIRGQKNAIQTVADKIVTKASKFPSQLISITHADDLPSAKALETIITKRLPNCTITLRQIGGVLGAHLGPKGIGAFCLNQKPERYCLTNR